LSTLFKGDGETRKIRIGEIFIQEGLLSEDQLNAALSEQKRSGRKLGRACIDLGYLDEDQVSVALARQLHVPFIDHHACGRQAGRRDASPRGIGAPLSSHRLDDTGASYRVGLADLTDLFAYDEITRILKREKDG